MSSSGRTSRRAQKPTIPSAWRPNSASKSPVPPTVSAISAGSERDASFACTLNHSTCATANAESSHDQRSLQKRSRLDSVSSLRSFASMKGIGGDQRPGPSEPHSDCMNCTDDSDKLSLTRHAIPPESDSAHAANGSVFAGSDVPSRSMSGAPHSKSSWFASLSRARGKANAADVMRSHGHKSAGNGLANSPVKNESIVPFPVPVAESESQPVVKSCDPLGPPQVPEPEKTRAPTPPRPVPTATGSKRTWLSPLPSSPSSPSSATTGPPLRPPNSATMSTVSSVDEEVPNILVVHPLPGPPVVTVQALPDSGENVVLASLNPSTSRFTLRIPLLGAAKVPLDQAVAREQASKGVEQPLDRNKASLSGDCRIASYSYLV
jgi:hypothetical protein